jgi:putative membrane-bound dehydrogenase-like protein
MAPVRNLSGAFCIACILTSLIAAEPRVHDPRLSLNLFAGDRDIVTPIGLAIDGRDRLFVIESHTHSPPRDYAGPKSDRIKVFEDHDQDGHPERTTVFADGLTAAMNLAFSRQGQVYVVCAREVWRLDDQNGDGVSESRARIAELRTSNAYPHSALLGITFSHDGWLYLSRGNNGSAAYTLAGTDGATVSGYGDGGNITRCRPDGSKLEMFATGFWNPFDLKFDSLGRLLCVDNDPDARGPNRLLHVVQEGDYGYQSIYGGSGNHPFQAWEGELPGTLPMIDGTGEAPSGLLDCSRAALPPDYAGSVLVTIWNENTITRHATEPRGVSLTATHSTLISGGPDFRPVALEADSRGNIYITDWVLVNYPNHGRGRIWKLSALTNQPLRAPRPIFAKPQPDGAGETFATTIESDSPARFQELLTTLRSPDPFLRHAAVVSLARPAFHELILAQTTNAHPKIRLGALLALRRAQVKNAERLLSDFLRDSDLEIRQAALQWIGESGVTSLRPRLDDALDHPNVSGRLFEMYLAAVECLDTNFARAFRGRARDKANQLPRRLEPGLVESILRDERRPAKLRALALTRLEAQAVLGNYALLAQLTRHENSDLQIEAIRTLARSTHQNTLEDLLALLPHGRQPDHIRAEALTALSWQDQKSAGRLLPLLEDPDSGVRLETVRALRLASTEPPVRGALQNLYERERRHGEQKALIEQLEFALNPGGGEPAPNLSRPETLADWQTALESGGDAAAGARVFFSAHTGCIQCHSIHNRGGGLGPDLGNIGQSVSRAQIIHSILRPSDQYPPQYQSWFIETRDGETHEGLQLDHAAGGALVLFTTSGRFERFEAKDVSSYGVRPRSLMPDGLEQSMTVAEFRDLVAFLEGLK